MVLRTLLSTALAVAASGAPRLNLQTMSGRPTAARFPVVLMFWRADCAPCRLELGDLPALSRAAAPVRLQLVGLQPPAELRVGLRAANLADDASDVAVQDAAGVLTS